MLTYKLFADIPDSPGLSDIETAKSLVIEEILGDFPFKDQASLAHTLGAMILPIVRPMIEGPTPLHLVDASTPGSGKTKLCQVISIPALGYGPASMAEGENDQEWRKRISASLDSGSPIIMFDNINRELKSASLSSALTSVVWEDRILGQSTIARHPVKNMWLATGNNVRLSNEISRRTIWIRLQPKIERPWQREGFKHDNLEKWVKQNRHQVLCALIILVKNWIAKGRLPGRKTLGSFEAWANVIGGILDASDVSGFLENAKALYEQADEETSLWSSIVLCWWDRFDSNEVTIKDLMLLLSEHDLLTQMMRGREIRDTNTCVGIELRKNVDRVFSGYQILSSKPLRNGSKTYRLHSVLA